MTTINQLDERRREALNQVQKSENLMKMLMGVFFVWELGLIAIIVFFMDFSNDMHVLILLSTAAIYGTMGIGLFSLGAYIRQNALKVIVAIEIAIPSDSQPA